MFYENQWANAGSIKQQGKIYGPGNPTKEVSLVAVEDIGDAAAAVLLKPKSHANKT